MPTGYTAPVAEGEITTLREFALRCARGMGAPIPMRDEPFDAPIPERLEPNTAYFKEQLAEKQRLLVELTSADDDQLAKMYERYLLAVAESNARYASTEQEQNYENMLSRVRAWEGAPEGLKEFMISQLLESIQFDCGYKSLQIEPLNFAEWTASTKTELEEELLYFHDQIDKEIARTESRNQWLAQLHASLAGIATADERPLGS